MIQSNSCVSLLKRSRVKVGMIGWNPDSAILVRLRNGIDQQRRLDKGYALKISIVTVVRNNPRIKYTLDSLLTQQFEGELEMIVIDGGSTDGTLEALDPYRDRISVLVSEPDRGIYDAMNKGIARASGDIIGILNSDDIYASANSLSTILEALRADDSLDAVYGNLAMVEGASGEVMHRFWRSGSYRPGTFERGWMPPHPTFYVRRSVFESYGAFDLSYHIAADFEWLVRVMAKGGIRTAYLDVVLVRMQAGGASNGSLKNIWKANRECVRACRKHGLSPSFFFIPLKLGSKVMQIFRH